MAMISTPLAIVGGGNMARAIIQGGTSAGVLNPNLVVVAEPDHPKRALLAQMGVHFRPSALDALTWLDKADGGTGAGQILLAIKPQVLDEVAQEFRHLPPGPSRVVVTILAGTSSAKVRAAVGPASRVVRAMPNLPASIGQGATALCLGEGAKPGDEDLAMTLFKGVGPLVVRIDEGLMHAFTALAGSGPAYVFYLAEAMVRAGVAMGFDQVTALKIVRQTIAGSGAMLGGSVEAPEKLRAAVTSKGGTTQAAVEVLDGTGAMDLIVRAVVAARDRGVAMAGAV